MTAEPYQYDAASPSEDSGAPPHNLDAEQAFLGALLYENEVFNSVSDWLLPEHFYDPVHGRIFDTAARRITGGGLADAVTLKTQLESDTGLRELGGGVYLAQLMRDAPESAAAPEYARIIYDLALRRSLISLGGEILRNASQAGPDQSARGLIEDTERSLFKLAESGSASKGFESFSSALTTAKKMAEAAYKRGGGLSGISSGLHGLDQKLGGLHRSDLIILAGRPSMGKTALATNIAFSIARAYQAEEQADGSKKAVNGGVVGFFSLEMSSDQLATRLIADYTGISSYHIRQGKIDAAQFEEITDAVADISEIPLYIDATGGLSIGALAARARRLKRTVGLDVLIVDYLQLVTAQGSRKTENRVQEVSEITQSLKALAKELNIPVVALSQLSRKVEDRDDKKPQLADLRESGSIEQDADVVMFVYREAYYLERKQPKEGTPEHEAWRTEMEVVRNRGEVIIAKQRHGPIGSVPLGFDPERVKFSDIEDTGRYDSY